MNKTYTAMAFLLAAGSFIFSPLSFAEQDDKKAESLIFAQSKQKMHQIKRPILKNVLRPNLKNKKKV